jgi:hypothetical protein
LRTIVITQQRPTNSVEHLLANFKFGGSMKISRVRFVSLLTAMAIVVLAGVSVPAVSYAQSELRLKIPFDFYVGDQRFDSGSYSVFISGDYIKVSDGKGHSKFVLTDPVSYAGLMGSGGGALVFTHYDNYYFLSEVRRGGYSTAHGLKKAPLEIQVARISATKEKVAFQTGH